MTYKFEGIIWDCDGVLMDSEVISCSVSRDFLEEFGVNVSLDYYIDNCMGRKFPETMKAMEEETGVKLSELVTEDDLKRRVSNKEKLFAKELKAISNVEKVLEKLEIPYAIASASSIQRLHYTLDVIGLKRFFADDKIFSAKPMKKNKAEPDIWLKVAKSLGVKPDKCLVIEDSPKGTKGAKKAGMSIFGFTGAGHMTPKRIEKLKNSGVELLFNDMLKLLELIK